jgi:hypothetical protein
VSTATYALYDIDQIRATEAAGGLLLEPSWVDISGQDIITISAPDATLFSPSDNLLLKLTATAMNASFSGPADQRRLQSIQQPSGEEVIPMTAGRGLQATADASETTVQCTVLTPALATCPSITTAPNTMLSLHVAKNGQDFTPLASLVLP